MSVKRVAVIGAGCAGLAALRALLSRPAAFDVSVFERSADIGGIWRYDGSGPMYRHLRTNLPKPVMSFADFPFIGTSDRSFATHQEVFQYIEDYCEDTKGRHLIKFNTEVLNVQPVSGRPDEAIWRLRFASEHGEAEDFFHRIFVCNGHYDIPFVPRIPGIENFSGKVMHSKYYDEPEVFANLKVIVVGARASGVDIAVGISPFAKEVIVSHRLESFPKHLLSNVRSAATISSFKDGAFHLTDGSILTNVDAVILCTGYQFDFPFLHFDCGVSITDGHCRQLWRHFVNVNHPSMFFLGIPLIVTPLPQLSMQAAAAISILEGQTKLPSREEMLADIETDFQRRIVKRQANPGLFHLLADDQWEYNDGLADFCGVRRLPDHIRKIYNDTWAKRRSELYAYRLYNYKVLPGEDFELERIEELSF